MASTGVDTAAPSTTMTQLPQHTETTSFFVSWSGSDTGGSGVASYTLQYQVNGGTWQTLISNTPQTSFYFQGAQTSVYGFRVQATDNAGNVQPWPGSAQGTTTVVVNPVAVVLPFNPPILQSTSPVTKSFTVNWKGYSPPDTFLTGFTVQYRVNNGPWTVWLTFPASQTSATFNWFNLHLPSQATYQFQATATNNVGQSPYELPSQYWATMIIDMQDRGSIIHLPLIFNSAP